MGKTYMARIAWLSKEQGGRPTVPVGDKYAPMIKIVNQPRTSPGVWSVFVFVTDHLSGNETLAEIKYLSDDAPDNLDRDKEFELYEGPKLVARGVVLDQGTANM